METMKTEIQLLESRSVEHIIFADNNRRWTATIVVHDMYGTTSLRAYVVSN